MRLAPSVRHTLREEGGWIEHNCRMRSADGNSSHGLKYKISIAISNQNCYEITTNTQFNYPYLNTTCLAIRILKSGGPGSDLQNEVPFLLPLGL